MLMLLVPILVLLLLEASELSTASQQWRHLHDHALQHLTCIGPQYPAQFRTVMQASPDMRTRLEVAVKTQQLNARPIDQRIVIAQKSSQEHKPTIKLKTDFSNFTG